MLFCFTKDGASIPLIVKDFFVLGLIPFTATSGYMVPSSKTPPPPNIVVLTLLKKKSKVFSIASPCLSKIPRDISIPWVSLRYVSISYDIMLPSTPPVNGDINPSIFPNPELATHDDSLSFLSTYNAAGQFPLLFSNISFNPNSFMLNSRLTLFI